MSHLHNHTQVQNVVPPIQIKQEPEDVPTYSPCRYSNRKGGGGGERSGGGGGGRGGRGELGGGRSGGGGGGRGELGGGRSGGGGGGGVKGGGEDELHYSEKERDFSSVKKESEPSVPLGNFGFPCGVGGHGSAVLNNGVPLFLSPSSPYFSFSSTPFPSSSWTYPFTSSNNPSLPLSLTPPPPPLPYFPSPLGSTMSVAASNLTIATQSVPVTMDTENAKKTSTESPIVSGENFDDPSLSFPPWGLAGGPGLTFGNLLGTDMAPPDIEGLGPPDFVSPPNDDKKGKGISLSKKPARRRRVKKEEEEDDGWEPLLWRVQLENIKKMREKRDAPVDLMGAHALAEQTTVVTAEVRICDVVYYNIILLYVITFVWCI